MEDVNLKKFSKYKIAYTEGQLKAIEKLVAFTFSDNLYIVLKGAAGTGKTTIIKEILNERRKVGSVCVSAPTHKAKRVIEQMTKQRGRTVQQLLKLRPNFNLDDFDINNPPYDNSSEGIEYIRHYTLVIVSEASMINNGLLKLILSKAKQFKTKIIFEGDPFQLPPVKDDHSPVFDLPNQIELTEIVRQEKDNPILYLLDLVRNDVRDKTSKSINYILSNKSSANYENKGFYVFDGQVKSQKQSYIGSLLNYFQDDAFKNNINHVKYLAYTNESINNWNQYIRHELLNDPHEILVKDDLLTAYSTIIDEFNTPIIVNSEDYIIAHVGGQPEIYPFTHSAFGIKGYLLRLQCVNDGLISSQSIFIVDHSDEKNYERLLNTFYKCKARAIKTKRWRSDFYLAFRNEHLLLTSAYDSEGSLLIAKDLDYGFALTVHKSQGSTYNNVFANVRDIVYTKYGKPRRDVDLRNRLLYVALSRTKDRAFLLI